MLARLDDTNVKAGLRWPRRAPGVRSQPRRDPRPHRGGRARAPRHHRAGGRTSRHRGRSRPGARPSSTRCRPGSGSSQADVTVAEREVAVLAAAAGRHRHSRAVRRHRHVQERPARRDDLPHVRRRRFHPHRHLHHRGHGFAGDRGGRQRELHQPGRAGPAGRGHARRLPRLEDPLPRSSRSSRPPTARRPRSRCASGSTSSIRASCRTWACKVAFQRARKRAGDEAGVVVPEAAVRQEDGPRFVWVVQNGRVARRAGDRRGAAAARRSPSLMAWPSGDKVVVEGPAELSEGARRVAGGESRDATDSPTTASGAGRGRRQGLPPRLGGDPRPARADLRSARAASSWR